MTSKQRLMLFVYRLVGVMNILNIIIRFIIMIMNPLEVPLMSFQIVTVISYLAHLFIYFKLYKDTIPVLTLILPTVIHGLLSFLFFKTVPWITLFGFMTMDLFYIIIVAYKTTYYPFIYESDYDLFDYDDDKDDSVI